MRSLEVPVGSRDAWLYRQVEALDHLAGGEVVEHHCMLIRQLRVDALLVWSKLPGAEWLVESYPVKGLQRVYVSDGQLKGMARRFSQGRSPGLTRESPNRPDAGVIEP